MQDKARQGKARKRRVVGECRTGDVGFRKVQAGRKPQCGPRTGIGTDMDKDKDTSINADMDMTR